MREFVASVLLLASLLPAAANDSTANIAVGGLTLTRTDAIEMRREDLSISLDQITVDYVFANITDQPVTTTVAFPLPEIYIAPFDSVIDLPSNEADDPFQFETTVDGSPVEMTIDRAAFHDGNNVTQRLEVLGIPLAPYSEATAKALDALPQSDKDALVSEGIGKIASYDAGKGWEEHLLPNWSFRLAYHWEQTFPPGRTVSVRHSYKPSVSSFVATEVGADYLSPEEERAFRERYCIEDDIVRAVKKAAANAPADVYSVFQDRKIDYVLTTGANWAKPIGRFRLVIDKGSPKNLVSFCGTGVKKIAPTRFEMVREDFVPRQDLHILFLVRQ